MKLAIQYEIQRPSLDDNAAIEETIEQCLLADELGFDYLWFVEHHFLTGFSMSPCPEVLFGALSRLTKQIRLGLGVVILPYHHPVRVAACRLPGPSGQGADGLRYGPFSRLRADGHGHRPPGDSRYVGRVHHNDPSDMGIREV